MSRDQGWLQGVLSFLSIPLGILFFFGLIINYDGVVILVDKDEYISGILKSDSLDMLPRKVGGSLVYFYGSADSVFTAIMVGGNDMPYVKSLLYEFRNNKRVELPVWYKPDGDSYDRKVF